MNDLALIVLNDEFAKSPIVNTVCLAPKDTTYDNQLCYAGGWGQTQFGKLNARQVFLKKFSLPIVPSKKCERELKETPLGNNFELDEKFICAGKLNFCFNNFDQFKSNLVLQAARRELMSAQGMVARP